jgi:hypothetical protein
MTVVCGGIVQVWPDTHPAIWDRLAQHDAAPADLYVELYRELVPRLGRKLVMTDLATFTSDPVLATEEFRAVSSADFESESQLVAFLETAATVLDDFDCEGLTDLYINLLESFVEKYNLRYDLKRPCELAPTLTGIFSSLICHVDAMANDDDHLGGLLTDFEASVRDLRSDRSEARIKTVFQKQFNLLEAIGTKHPSTTKHTLGALADELENWPHEELKDALKKIYKFGNDYPGIRHSGRPDGMLTRVAMRDLIGVAIMLAGFIPYLSSELDYEAVFLGNL